MQNIAGLAALEPKTGPTEDAGPVRSELDLTHAAKFQSPLAMASPTPGEKEPPAEPKPLGIEGRNGS